MEKTQESMKMTNSYIMFWILIWLVWPCIIFHVFNSLGETWKKLQVEVTSPLDH